ncbi:peptidylprolyl isomerase [Commensalibacter nepenthis]|uniref:Peptidyl-prolyl cis-trans isomerase n=1 Tax=Commensalibacter nepenthis TaxID=3043872 RepID=A0ABT6Q9B8_9PROT|nr:peptidylprolyl isomerase [Commensalibacter sp. TBRC 10068]MDI2113399.1 peptidylprolyl isomerase [Commensalibacter sp. TBRC 10068]
MDTTDQNKMLQMELKHGNVKIKLYPDLAPLAAERLLTLSQQGFYDNTPFHRVIEGFMAQGGDPSGTGTKGSDLPDLKAEFTKAESFRRGTIGMARTMDPNSANSQFFIMFDDAPHLNGQYTIVGQVIEGMEFVDQIKRGGGANGMVNDPDRIIKMSVVNE